MPYISIEKQRNFEPVSHALAHYCGKMENPGDLNYVLTSVMLVYLKQHGMKYATMNDIVGAMESAKAEFQRRVVNPYESQKAYDVSQNGGDMYAGI